MPGRLDYLSFHLVDPGAAGEPSGPGDLELIDAWFLLAYFSPAFRGWYDGEGASRMAAGAAEPRIEQAMGGLRDGGEPRDTIFTPEQARDLARALGALELGARQGEDPSEILNWFEDLASDLDGTDSDLDAGGGREALGAWVAAQVDAIRALYEAAATADRGVRLRWHATP